MPSPAQRVSTFGTTIFTEMNQLAQQYQALNLGQGKPDFDTPSDILQQLIHYLQTGQHNQYAPGPGTPLLRQAVADHARRFYGLSIDPVDGVVVTAGATEAIFASVLGLVDPGDEVIVFEPTYDSYIPSIELAGGKVVPITLNAPDLCIPFDTLAAAITPRTRLIMLNTPHNPTGRVWHADDIRKLAEILAPTNVLLLSDEVYEHMVYDGVQHASVARIPELARRAFVVSSFGKTYHVTGWKVGYVAAPAALMAEFRKVHQFNVFTVNTPMQHGLANYMADPRPYLELPAFYQRKRDLFRAGLEKTRFKLLPCQGTYFQCVDYSAISDLPEAEFAKWLTSEIGVAAIPVSAFYSQPHESGVVRFCFAKKDETLQVALERLSKV